MTKLTRTAAQWNSGVMLGWNSSRKMDGIMRHPNNKYAIQQQQNHAANPEIKVTPDNQNLISSFFPQSSGGGGETKVKSSIGHRTKRHYFEPQKDVSPEFLEYLRSFTKRDFEHAVEEDVQNNNLIQSSTIDNNNNDTSSNADPDKYKLMLGAGAQRKHGANSNLVHGYQFFGTPPATPSATLNLRPSTVPRYLSRKDGGRSVDLNNRSILRPGGNGTAGPVLDTLPTNTDENNNKIQPLTKTKVTPSQVDNVSSKQNEVEQPSVEGASYSSSYTATPSESQSERPSSSTSSSGSKRVTFAADVVNYERENKPPKKRKMPKRRRQGFPHPSRGIFVPPEVEIVESSGPNETCKDNAYLNFNQVWTHPAARSTGESQASRIVRQERFHRIMNDLEHAHIHYNRLISVEQNDYLINSIFKRYILVLDLALMEGHLTQVEHLLETISKSVPVLQQNIFYYLYGPKIIKDMEQNTSQNKKEQEHPDLVLTRYALSRLSGPLPRHDSADMSIETVLVKLCLELIELVFSQYGSSEFRNALSVVPFTVRHAISLLKQLRTSKDAFCYIKWINNSAVQRDFRSILKNLGLLDRYGCRADISPSLTISNKVVEGVSGQKSKSRRVSGQSISKRPKTPPKPVPEMMQTRHTAARCNSS